MVGAIALISVVVDPLKLIKSMALLIELFSDLAASLPGNCPSVDFVTLTIDSVTLTGDSVVANGVVITGNEVVEVVVVAIAIVSLGMDAFVWDSCCFFRFDFNLKFN